MKDRTWQAAGVITVLALALIYRMSMTWEWGAWWRTESEYSHGILVPIMSGFLVWFNWKRLEKLPVMPSLWGLAILLPMAFVQFAGHFSGGMSLAGMTLPLAIFGMVILLFGFRIAKELTFAILFLYFMCVPPATFLTQLSHQIQMWSTVLATGLLKLMQFDATRSGINIVLPNITVAVASPCSGIRTLVALLAFSTFFAYMKVGPLWGRLILVAVVPPLALFVNSLRVLMIALVGEFYGEDLMHAFHDYSGYIVIVVAFAVLIQISKVVRCRDFKSMP